MITRRVHSPYTMVAGAISRRPASAFPRKGQPFDAGVAAQPLNLDEFGPDDMLVVDQMLEPIVMGPEGIVKEGSILLRKAAS